MKKFFIAIAVLLGFTLQAQTFSIAQDPKLALIGDNIGNAPWTWNIRAKIELNGLPKLFDPKSNYTDSKRIGYVTIAGVYEFADLDHADYTRYGIQVGYTFFTIGNLEATPSVGYGGVIRAKGFTFSWEFEGDLTYWISDHIGVTAQLTYTQRTDWIYKDTFWRESGYVGIKYRI